MAAYVNCNKSDWPAYTGTSTQSPGAHVVAMAPVVLGDGDLHMGRRDKHEHDLTFPVASNVRWVELERFSSRVIVVVVVVGLAARS